MIEIEEVHTPYRSTSKVRLVCILNLKGQEAYSLRPVRSSVVPEGTTIPDKTSVAQSVLLLLADAALVNVQVALL